MSDQSWGKNGNYQVPKVARNSAKEISLLPVASPKRKGMPLPGGSSSIELKPVGDAANPSVLPRPTAQPVAQPANPALAEGLPTSVNNVMPTPVAEGLPRPQVQPSVKVKPVVEAPVVEAPAIEPAVDDWGDLTTSSEQFNPMEGAHFEVEKKQQKRALPSPKGLKNRPRNLEPALIKNEEGWDEDNPAFEMEGAPEGEEAETLKKSGRGIRITERDIQIIHFLARYRFAAGSQMARYVRSSRKAVTQRLAALAKAGLIRKEEVTRGHTLWTPTMWGLSTVDLDFRPIAAGISPVTIGHTLGLVNIAIELETGGEDLLRVGPQYNRVGEDGIMMLGENLVSEREIRQEESRLKKSVARVDYERALMKALRDWSPDEISPELEVGNEGMFIMWATRQGQKDHVPDLVVTRDRIDAQRGGNIAIELELNRKSKKEWERILASFKESEHIYQKVVYFTHKNSIASDLSEAATRVGLAQQGRFAVLPYQAKNGNLPFWG